jgi:hypothetical protein
MNDHKTNTLHFSMTTLAYALIFLVTLGLRFALLGHHPLNDQEANLALQALALSKGEQAVLTGQAGYVSLTAVNFFVFGAFNFMARFWPALIGTLAVLLPLLFRPWLGRKTALLLAALIAIDPVLIGASRTADGSTLAMVGLMAGVGFFLMRKPLLSGVCLGASLAGGAEIWIGALLLILLFFIGRASLVNPTTDTPVEFPKRLWGTTAITAGVSLIVISTTFFTHPVGISAVGASLGDMLAALGEIDGAALLGMSAAWLWMELPLVLLALWALIDGLLKNESLTRWLGLWWGLALVLAVITPAIGVNHFHWMSIPILILAAIKLGPIFQHQTVENRLVFIAESVVVGALIVFSCMNLLALVNNLYFTPEETRNRIIGTLLPLILLVIMTILLSWGWSVTDTRKGFITGMLLIFAFAAFSNTWKASGLGSRPQFELSTGASYATGTAPLMTTIADISRWNTGHSDRIDILLVGVDLPSLEWALRDFERVSRDSGYNPNLSPSLIVTGIDRNITSSTSYRGQKFLWSVKTYLTALNLGDWIKWATFRTAPVQKDDLILWARNDLFSGSTTP